MVSPEEILAGYAADINHLCHELRALIRETVPEAGEAGYAGWGAIAYRHPRAGYFCGLFPAADSVKVLFEHGHALSDPAGLLQGKTKQTRSVELRPPHGVPIEPLTDLLRQAVAHGEDRRGIRRKALAGP